MSERLHDISADRIAEVVADGDGFWRTCTGCHNTIDGYDDGFYPISETLGCKIGSGCRECGGLGATWDDTDYEALGEYLSREPASPPEPAAQAVTEEQIARAVQFGRENWQPFAAETKTIEDAQDLAIIQAILALLPRAGKGEAGWLPIESAPKDGMPILGFGLEPIYDRPALTVRETRWTLYPKGSMAHADFVKGHGPSGSWYWSEPIHNWASSWKPTHWRPLPAPPITSGGDDA